MPRYKLNTGLDYPLNPNDPPATWEMVRHEAGEVVDDIPAISLGWLLDAGQIEVAPDVPSTSGGQTPDAEVGEGG